MSSPLHIPAPGAVAWTRGNLGEALPGLCTPLSWTFFGPATEDGIRGGFHLIGALSAAEVPIPAEVGERFVTPIHGWPTANIDMMARMAERLPGVDPAQIEKELFGEVRDIPRHPTKRRYPAVAAKMPVAVATCLRRVRASRAAAEAWWRCALTAPLTEADAQRVLREARPLFVQNMLLHTVISMLASGVYEKVDLLARAAGPPHSAPQLVTGYGSVEETRVAADLWALSRGELSLETVLDRHGWHGINNGQLHVTVWREEPEHVRALAARFRELPDEQSPDRLGERQRTLRQQAEAALLADLPRRSRPPARLTLTMAQKFVAHREVGKAGYLIAVDGARLAARTLGEIWAKDGHLVDPEDVVFLTLAEVQAGPQPPWADLVVERRELDRIYRQQSLPMAWVGVPEPVTEVAVDDGSELSGLGVSPGVVEGIARVVIDPHEDDLRPGEILVCATTDPSWVSLFLAAAAVVIDIGGQLSHGAIVARELGIPCVVNTRNGSRRIRSGDALRINGTTGEVSILVPQETS